MTKREAEITLVLGFFALAASLVVHPLVAAPFGLAAGVWTLRCLKSWKSDLARSQERVADILEGRGGLPPLGPRSHES